MELTALRELLALLRENGVTTYSDKTVNITLAPGYYGADDDLEGLTEIPVMVGGLDVEEVN